MSMAAVSSGPCAVVAEDEPLLRQHLVTLLQRHWPQLRIVAAVGDGDEALAAIEREAPDVVFLDIRMPGMSGLEVAAELADKRSDTDPMPQLVFVTAYGEFALEAFDLAAVDYLLKPVSDPRLAQCVARCKQRMAQPATLDALVAQLQRANAALEHPQPSLTPLRFVRAGLGDTVTMIALEDVCYFRATDKYTTVVTAEGEALLRTSLKELIARLPRGSFAQIHRGAIVNLSAVEAAVRDIGGRVSLKLKRRPETLLVSRIHADQFKAM